MLIAFVCASCFEISGQDLYRFGILPVFNTYTKFEKNYSLNVKYENRQIFQEGSFSTGENNSDYNFERQDLTLILGKRIAPTMKLGLGYLVRFESERFVQRTLQQVAFTHSYGRIRTANRIRTDQTWDPDEPFEFRLRYRLALEYPLFGNNLDPKELYLKPSIEYLARFRDQFVNEVRIVPVLGYLGKDRNSFEVGLDYRFGSILQDLRGHGFWVYFGYYLRINRNSG